eukprot:UN31337
MIHLFQKYKYLADPKQEVVLGHTTSKRIMDPKFLLLAMEGLYQNKAYEESLKLTSYMDEKDAYAILKQCCAQNRHQSQDNPYELDYLSVLCLLRGKLWEALEHQEYSVKWYERALDHDPKNYEAFSRLTERRMLNHDSEKKLLENIQNNTSDLKDIGWLNTFLCIHVATV